MSRKHNKAVKRRMAAGKANDWTREARRLIKPPLRSFKELYARTSLISAKDSFDSMRGTDFQFLQHLR